MTIRTMHLGDVGTIIRATVTDGGVVVPLAAATTKQMKFKKPDGTVLVKAGAFTTDGADGNLQYTTIQGDLDQVGKWQGEVYVEFPTGKWHSDTFDFHVRAHL
jgi:hypothetical protein